jgi:tetratricopeptide (TPR) repeat protein
MTMDRHTSRRLLSDARVVFAPQIERQDESIQDPRHVEAQDAVVVDFVGRCATDRDDTNGAIFHQATDWTIMVGDKDVTPALEMGIRFMKEGEHAVVYAHSKFAYGGMQRIHGSYELPTDSQVVYQVHVKSVMSDDSMIASPAFQMELAKSKKVIGNDVYANEWSGGHGKNKALLLYKKAGDALSSILEDPAETMLHEEAKSILIDCLNNASAVHMRVKDYGKAKESATLALVRDPNNLKALLRAARAAMLDPSCSFDEATAAVAAAEDVDPNDVDVKKLRIELQRRKRDYKKKTKDIMSKMSQAMKVSNDEPSPESSKESTTIDTTKEKSDESGLRRDVNPATSESEDELDKRAQKWVSYLPYIVQFVMLIISYIWMAYFSRSAVEANGGDGGSSKMEHNALPDFD